jgi:CRP-like cAMP-binding protein
MEVGIDKEDYRDRFSEVLLFRALSPEAQAHLYDAAEALFFDGGETIVKEGDRSPSFFAVLEGSVVVEVRQDDRDVYICTLGRGSVFGEAAMFLKSARTASVRAADPTVVLQIERTVWMEFLRQHPREGNKALLAIVYGLLTKLRSANQELAFERRSDSAQDEVDALVAELAGS